MTTSPAAPVLGAVVLAAGQARRMGGRPKPLIERDGVPLVRRVVLALVEAGVREVVVVLGHCADEVAAALADLAVRRGDPAGKLDDGDCHRRRSHARLPAIRWGHLTENRP